MWYNKRRAFIIGYKCPYTKDRRGFCRELRGSRRELRGFRREWRGSRRELRGSRRESGALPHTPLPFVPKGSENQFRCAKKK